MLGFQRNCVNIQLDLSTLSIFFVVGVFSVGETRVKIIPLTVLTTVSLGTGRVVRTGPVL